MAIIYTYPPLTALQGSDLLLISDTSTQNSTKSVTLANIAAYVTGTGGGTGTTNTLTRWSDGPGGLLGDSIVAQDVGATTLTITGNTVGTGNLTISGATQSAFGGQVTIPLTPVANTDAASKGYVDTEIAGIPAGLIFQGNWDARNVAEGGASDQGNPDLATPALKVTGHYYVVTTAGSATPNGPATTPNSWNIGDWVVFIEQGATDRWEKIDQTFVAGSGAVNNVTVWDSVNTVTSTADDFYYNLGSNRLGLGTSSPNFKMDIGGGDLRMEENYGILFGGTGSNHQNFMIYTTGDPFGGVYPGTWSVGMGNRSGALSTPALTINRVNPGADGQITFNEYGGGTFTGTATYDLSVDANGNIIETTGGGAGGPFVPYMSGADQIARTECATDANTSLGCQALQNLTTGERNTALGYQALLSATNTIESTAIGYRALATEDGTVHHYNVAVGGRAGENITTGFSNILIGVNAGGAYTTQGNNVLTLLVERKML